MSDTNRIEKTVLLKAPKARVWRALSDAREFGTWFRVNLEGPFQLGKSVKGKLAVPGYEHLTLEMIVERMDAPDHFSYRWHPFATDPAVDYSAEPMTLVEFRLEDAEEGTVLTIVESGFDLIPQNRRDEAFRMNDKGWAGQLQHIQRHVEG
jgi:uncharacterized protein YndB with AHSA1/START domain